MTGKRKRYAADFKAKVALEAPKGELIRQKPLTTIPHPEHRAYKYLLRGLTAAQLRGANHFWAGGRMGAVIASRQAQ